MKEEPPKNTEYPKGSKLVCSGRMCSGKDWVAIMAGYTCVSIAEPLYRLSAHYLGTDDKRVPEVRAFMQTLGAWGRGEQGPDSCAGFTRQQITQDVRAAGGKITGMDNVGWKDFGKRKTFWLVAAAKHADKLAGEGVKVAITNARFPEELAELKQRGFRHIHVMCSELSRLNRAGRNYTPSIDEDATEQMAIGLNRDIAKNGGGSLEGGFAIWNDKGAAPYPQMLSPEEFCSVDKSQGAPSLEASGRGPGLQKAGRDRGHQL